MHIARHQGRDTSQVVRNLTYPVCGYVEESQLPWHCHITFASDDRCLRVRAQREHAWECWEAHDLLC